MDCFPTDLNSWPPLRLPREFLALQGRVEPVSGTTHFFPQTHCPPNGSATTRKVDWTSEQGCGTKGVWRALFSPFSLVADACRMPGAGKVTDQPSLPSFPLLFVSVGKIKKVWGGWELFILIQFLATKSYKNIQRYFTHYQFATVFPSSHCHCPPFPRSSPETFEKTMYGYMMTCVSYLQSVFPKEGVFHILRSDKNTIRSLCASQ